jgi:hypothetical protein
MTALEAPSTYPAWQQTIRAAQADYLFARAEAEKECAEKAAAKEADDGRHLGHVLSFFGIDAEPTINNLTLDGITFRLVKSSSTFYSEDVNYLVGQPRDSEKVCIWFTLRIEKDLTYLPDEDRERIHYSGLYDDITVSAMPLESLFWPEHQAELANIIDRINEEWERQLTQIARPWNESEEPDKPEPTPAETLLEALRVFISQELADRVVPLDY